MRVGVVEAGVLSVLFGGGGYASSGVVKECLSGFSRLGGLASPSVWEMHSSICRAYRSLERKGVVFLDRRGSRVVGVRLNLRTVGAEFLCYTCAAARRELS